MTNVAFAAIYTPLGMEPISGYEMQYFDPERNAVVGSGPLGYAARAYAWRDYYQVMTRTTLSAAGYFFHPRRKARATMQKIADSESYKIPATIDDPAILAEIEASLKTIGYASP